MNDEDEARKSAGGGAAAGLALGNPLDPRAAGYLEEQTRLARLQAESLIEQNAFELSHLRFRRFSDWAKFALEISAGLVVLLLVCGLGTMVWNASRSRDLVVDPFSVPSDMAQSGMTGSVLAARVLDRLGAMQASTNSLAQGAGSYRSEDRDKVRVVIPDTGISIGELDRYLRQWLGDDIAVAGDLVHVSKGLALTVRYGDQPGHTVTGGDLDALIEKAAEQLYRSARPLRYVDYLDERGRFAEADAIVGPMTTQGDPRQRALVYITMASLRYEEGDTKAELDAALTAARLDPSNAAAWYAVDAGAFNLSHRQQALEAEEAVLSLIAAGRASALNPDMATTMPAVLGADRAIDKSDAMGAIAQCQNAIGIQDCDFGYMVGYEIGAHDIAEARRYLAMMPATGISGKPNPSLLFSQAWLGRLGGDWTRVRALDETAAAIATTEPNNTAFLHVQIWPQMAFDLARAGDVAAAEALIAKTAFDCDDCDIARGRIAAVKRDWAAAARWFALVSRRTPSMPAADAAWGAMLMAKGDLDGAIAKFEAANRKSPHFADPLEMWGEALIAKNRSDLAVAKFEEAARYAPNWGRLHLKWGEALWWLGRKDDAAKQFASAAALFLTPAERADLARFRK
ncbi:MAG TPA: hypothetical protein VJ476_14210 [Rhizomicrobium sp.]|nr:hypothetical protein [Rhizomicrobium sp.]